MALVLMISPMTPHIAEELWEMLGFQGGIANAEMAALIAKTLRAKSSSR